MKLSLLHRNVNAFSHRKGNLMALAAVDQFELWLKVRNRLSNLSLTRQGPCNLVWVKQVFELSQVELTEFHCSCTALEITRWRRGWTIKGNCPHMNKIDYDETIPNSDPEEIWFVLSPWQTNCQEWCRSMKWNDRSSFVFKPVSGVPGRSDQCQGYLGALTSVRGTQLPWPVPGFVEIVLLSLCLSVSQWVSH